MARDSPPEYLPPLKIFVEEGLSGPDAIGSEQKTQEPAVEHLTGESAKHFYESLVSESCTSSSCQRRETICRSEPKSNRVVLVRKSNHWGSDLLKLAQDNQADEIAQALEENPNICVDATDPFGWTALMCASCSGAENAVRVLLKYQANPDISDKHGNTALTLARRKKFYNIVHLLKNKYKCVVSEEEKKLECTQQNFYCHTCDTIVQGDSSSHECSTVHLFNSKQKHRTFYGIPESNKGFQMLLKGGWDREKGLGPNGTGPQFPVKVSKKNDRKGIGCPTPSRTGKQSLEAGTRQDLDENNIQRLMSQKQEKCFERNFRLQFS